MLTVYIPHWLIRYKILEGTRKGCFVYIPHWLIRYKQTSADFDCEHRFIFLIGWFDTISKRMQASSSRLYSSLVDSIRQGRAFSKEVMLMGLYSSLVDSIPYRVSCLMSYPCLYSSLVDSILPADVQAQASRLKVYIPHWLIRYSHSCSAYRRLHERFIFLIGWFDTGWSWLPP